MTPSPNVERVPNATGGPLLLEVTGVHKRFGGVLALRGVSLGIRAGEVHALVGENGAGKSTLINILAGAVRRDAGPRGMIGVHKWRGEWLVNSSRRDLVAIEMEPPQRGWFNGIKLNLRRISVSPDDPAGLTAALS